MKIAIVIPTYNESENIARLIDVLGEEFAKDPKNTYKMLIVDGNSPDGTAKIIQEKASTRSYVKLLLEPAKRGLGAAYMFGFKDALENEHADVVVEMDADFQHDPKDITRFVAEIEKGADYVIGSRFIAGGSIPKDWALYRKALSVGGSLFSKLVLGIYTVNDFTSGYRATRVKGFLDTLDLTSVLSGGFAYKIDLLFKMYKLGAKIKEIPITFGLRDKGDSKMERNNFADSLRVVLTIRYNENKSFFKFVLVGFTGLFIDTLLFNVIRLTPLGSKTAPIISGLIAMLATFALNNMWSFSDRKIASTKTRIISLVVYILSSLVPIMVRSKLVYIAVHYVADTFVVSNAAFFIGITFGLVWNFTIYSKIIWRKKDNK